MSTPKVSHGRGGAANISADDTPYTDGEIVREGVVGDQGDGAYSSGRGGTGNIGGAPVAAGTVPHDADVIPETATRIEKEESHHVGRGGAGNEKHVHEQKAEKKEGSQESFLDKAKSFFKGKKDSK